MAFLAITALAAVAAGSYRTHLRRHDAALALSQQAAQALSEARTLQVAPARSTSVSGDTASVDAVTQHLGQIAEDKGLRVSSVRIDHQPDQAGGVTEVRIATRAQGEYGALKLWVGELLALHRSLALSSASLRRSAPDKPLIDAEIAFSLFVKSAP